MRILVIQLVELEFLEHGNHPNITYSYTDHCVLTVYS
jgi:hypothetical protein